MDSSDINLIDRFVLMQVREMKYLYISVIFWVSMTEVILLYHVVFGKRDLENILEKNVVSVIRKYNIYHNDSV